MKHIGVFMGGPSSEHDVSLMSGTNVLRALQGRYDAIPIFISKSGAWLVGADRHWMGPGEILPKLDGAFIALHGEYGEDGSLQKLLDHFRVKYTGSEALPSAIAMNKHLAQKTLEREGIQMPRSLVLGPHNLDTRAVLAFGHAPWIVKPRSRGSSVGVSKATTRDELADSFQKALAHDTHLIVQEYIPGREITCGVLEDAHGRVKALAPIEIVPPTDADFFDYRVKYNGKTQEVCPADFHGAMLAKIQETALRVHHALGLRHYSRIDMMLKPHEKTRGAPELYVLEANTLPGLTSESLFPKAALHAGLEFPDLVNHLLSLARVV